MAWVNGEWILTPYDRRVLERAAKIGCERQVSIIKSVELAEVEIRREDARRFLDESQKGSH